MPQQDANVPPRFYRITFMIGLGFFTMGLMDPLYDNYVPVFLNQYLDSRALIGVIMTFDNILALSLIPLVTALSDRTRTRIGRRMPYILLTLPLSAVVFFWLPSAGMASLAALIGAIVLLNLFKQSARGPVVALMPDTIPGEYRSEANGVINTMGGIAAIVGTIALAPLMDLRLELPLLGDTSRRLPFMIAALLIMIATPALFITVKERNTREDAPAREPVLRSLKLVFTSKDKSAVYVLLALLLWFSAYWGMRPFMTLYTIEHLGLSEGLAGFSTGMVAVAYALSAIPSGIVAHRIGRKRTIRFSLAALSLLSALMFTHELWTLSLGSSQTFAVGTFWALLFGFGVFWASVITNSFPMLWQMAEYDNMGIYTGLYYTFSQTAAIVAPPTTGVVVDLFGLRAIFGVAAVVMVGAFAVIRHASGGEPQATESTHPAPSTDSGKQTDT
ncbi:MAG: MFS transporter [Spirochaetaceae bacterium]|nr:MAG: MFS transporter [Spirochaetaceae bacterium]